MQVKAQLDRTAYRSRHGTDNQSALVKASKNKANPATDEVRVENQAVILTQLQWRCTFSFFNLRITIRENLTSRKKKKKNTNELAAQHDKTLQETIAFPDKRKLLLVIQIQETI